jgi:5-methylcytosine-specific restriction endonuclease McrA
MITLNAKGGWMTKIKNNTRGNITVDAKTTLLKRQQGKCLHCGLRFIDGNVLEVHHRNGDKHDSRYDNLLLLHAHCHDEVHG